MPPSPLVLNFALSQVDRLAMAAPPTAVQVDGRSLPELLRLAVDHGQLITFYDLTNAPDRDWSDFFAADPAIALAMQASLNPRAIEEELQTIGQRLRQDHRPLVRPEPWSDLVDLIRQLLATLRRSPLPAGPLASLLHHVERPAELVDAASNLSRYLETTGLDLRLGHQAVLLKESELRRLENLLRDFLGVLLATLAAVRQEADQALREQLRTSGHAPHVALYIAFIRLLQFVQGRLNQLPDALLDFYHQTVLRQDGIADDAWQRDHLMLAFRRKPGTDLALVPCQTPFSAGVDDAGLPIVFTTDQDLEVQGAAVVAMEVMRVRGRPLHGDGLNALVRLDDVWLTRMALPLPFPAIGPQVPLFGYPVATEGSLGVTRPGVLGFAVGSPLLALEGGQRRVTLTLRISANSLRGLAACAPGTDPATLPAWVCRTLEQALRWDSTTAHGLHPLTPTARILPPEQILPPETRTADMPLSGTSLTIALEFCLPASAPSWQGCPGWGEQPLLIARLLEPSAVAATVTPPAQASDAPSTTSTTPAATVPLPPSASATSPPLIAPPPAASAAVDPLPPLATLSLLHLLEVQLDVDVLGLSPRDLQSSVGRLDPSQPLPLFGPGPVCGSFFSVGAPELLDKPLDEVSLRLQWHGLPISREGFRGHYSAYRLDGDGQLHPPGALFDNACFRVELRLDVVSPPADGSLPEPITLPLFQSGGPIGPDAVAPTTTLIRSELKGMAGVGGLRLVLTAPLHGFGDALYAINCLEASRQLASSFAPPAPANSPALAPRASDSPPAWPNPPWCPSAASVQLDYRCAPAMITPQSAAPDDPRLRLFHLSPLTGHQPVPWSGAPDIPLLPSLLSSPVSTTRATASAAPPLEAGTVLLTLSEPFRQLSLLFGLTTSGSLTTSRSSASLRVEIWDGQAWEQLPDNALQDGTSALSRTGLLRLTLPGNQTTTRLRLCVDGFGDSLPDLICLEPNAVSATWQGPGGRQSLNRSLPAGKVTAALTNLPGIAEVRQPLPSAGGVAPASADMQKVCLAERMRHKERAIQVDDYALLLLRAFPVLWQVAVLPAQRASGEREAGCVTLIPIPGPESPTVPDPTIPSCDGAFGERLLRELQPRVSPFVRLQVASPPYCRIRVCAAVVVEESRLASALQQLQNDLVRFLSPWPAPDLGPRPKNYHEESAISQFIRERRYIKSISTLKLLYEVESPSPDSVQPPTDHPPTGSHIYFTSALQHALTACLTNLTSVPGLEGG